MRHTRYTVFSSGTLGSIEPAYWSCDAEASASSDASASCYRTPEDVGVLAVVVTKLELGKVQRQIFLAHVMVRSYDSALQQRPEKFSMLLV